MKKIPLGISDFKTVISECYYVDKTLLIKDLLENPSGSVLLFTRPRRFGKSLALSTINTFFDILENDSLLYFKDTNIAANEEAMKEMNKYQTVLVSFKDCHALSFDEMLFYIKEEISNEYKRHHEQLVNSDDLTSLDKQYIDDVIKNKLDQNQSSSSLRKLTEYLYKISGKKVILLIDEYDTPIQSAVDNNYYQEAINFVKRLYGTALKENNYIKFAVCTGITRIGKESIFSGLNNVVVDSVLNNKYSHYFGFTAQEVKELLRYYSCEDQYENIKSYYDGYYFGREMVFNSWSVLYCLRNDCLFDTYWSNTSSFTYIRKVIGLNEEMLSLIYKLINGVTIRTELTDSFTYENYTKSNILGLLVHSGYLSSRKIEGTNLYDVFIPNIEIKEVFSEIIMSLNDDDNYTNLVDLKCSFISGKTSLIEDFINNKLLETLSYYDFSNEKSYQIMLLTLSALLFRNMTVKSEVNVGKGRCDIMIEALDHSISIIIELKKLKTKTSSSNMVISSRAALNQIKSQEYYKGLVDRNSHVLIYGISFYKNASKIAFEKIK